MATTHLRFSRNNNNSFVCCFLLLLLTQTISVLCYQYKVGDLDSWNIPSDANPKVYANWVKGKVFKIGDSLLFLYPPSQDSVLQVSANDYTFCKTKDPILTMKNGNSLFNVTAPGDYFFISGAKGHCQKLQRLHIFVPGGNLTSSSFDDNALPPIPPYDDSSSSPASAPSALNNAAVGSPQQQHSSSPSLNAPFFSSIFAVGLVLPLLFGRNI